MRNDLTCARTPEGSSTSSWMGGRGSKARSLLGAVALGLFGGALVGAAGCDDPEAHEAAPYIQALDYGPEAATVGQQVSVVGTFAFRDPDRDIGYIAFLIVAPDDSVQEVPPQEVPSLRGQRSGTDRKSVV